MPCCLTANGTDFQVDAYMLQTKLTDIELGRKGDLTSRRRRLKKSVVSIQVSDGDFSNFAQQARDAVTYLSKNLSEVKKLAKYRGVDEAYLSFAIEQQDEIAVFTYFPPDLLVLAGKIGLGINLCQFRCGADPVSENDQRRRHSKG
jgi:hypothetical protein